MNDGDILVRRRRLVLAWIALSLALFWIGTQMLPHKEQPPHVPLWRPGRLPADLRAYKVLDRTSWEPGPVATCRDLLVSSGVVRRKSDVDLVSALEAPDRATTIFIFREPGKFSARYGFRIRHASLQIIERYYVPDA